MGLQFENLVINNRNTLLDKLHIRAETVVNDGPYFQKTTKKNKGCQIDYLIQTRLHELYIVEIKFSRKELDTEIIHSMENKINNLTKPKHHAIRPVLVHVNGVKDAVSETNYFYQIINFTDFLN